MATIEVLEAGLDDKPVLQRLLQLYLHDFSELMEVRVDAQGCFQYPGLDSYWTDAARHPFLFRVEGHWAGFALVCTSAPNDMAEFFVMRGFRRSSVGIAAAREIFGLFPGAWQTRQVATNAAATAFWRKAIPVGFEEDVTDHGAVQRFSIPDPSLRS